MSSELLVFIVVFGVLYLGVGAIVARKSLRWNQEQGRSRGTAVAIAVGAGLVWPLTIWFWEADWLATGRRTWRGDR